MGSTDVCLAIFYGEYTKYRFYGEYTKYRFYSNIGSRCIQYYLSSWYIYFLIT